MCEAEAPKLSQLRLKRSPGLRICTLCFASVPRPSRCTRSEKSERVFKDLDSMLGLVARAVSPSTGGTEASGYLSKASLIDKASSRPARVH